MFIRIQLLLIFSLFLIQVTQQQGIIIRAQIMKPQKYDPSDYNQYVDQRGLRVLLNQGLYSTYPDENGVITFNNIPMGKYIMEVASKAFVYEKVLIQFFSQKQNRAKINEQSDIQISKIHPFTYEREVENIRPFEVIPIRPLVKVVYFEKQEEFNVLSLLKSPYAIMGIITLLLVVCMKKMPNMQELQEQQAQAPQQQQQSQNQQPKKKIQ